MSTTMQAIIVNGEVVGYFSPNASSIEFDNTGTSLSSTDVQNAIEELSSRKETIIPSIGSITGVENRNFYVTDETTYIEYHFCIEVASDISANAVIVTLPAFAQNKSIQYGFITEIDTNKWHLIYNHHDSIYLDDSSITSSADKFIAGFIRISLI